MPTCFVCGQNRIKNPDRFGDSVLLDLQTEKQYGFRSLKALVNFLTLLTQGRATR